MKKLIILMGAMVLAACGSEQTSAPPAANDTEPKADMVLTNGNVLTVEEDMPKAEAIAIVGDKIAAVGTSAEIAAWIGDDTEVIDLSGQTAIPGFIEGHGHYTSYGDSFYRLELRYDTSWQAIVDKVERAVAGAEPGEWIVGRGWHQDKWTVKEDILVDGIPVHDKLSAVSPNNPVMLIHTSGHAVFANQAAMDAANTDGSTVPPEGGEIVLKADGTPSGMMREAAQDAIRAALADYEALRTPEQAEAELRRAIITAGEESLKYGITSFQDLGTTYAEVDLLKKMADEGTIPVRLWMAFDIPYEELALPGKLEEYRMVGYGNNFLTVRGIGEKVLDGALGTHGGWLLEPYTDMPESYGLNVVPVDDIKKSADLALEYGYQMAIQGIGDRATRELLDIYGAIKEANPDADLRWRIEHPQVIHPDDIPRFAKYDVIPAAQGIFACSDGGWVEDRLGKDRTLERSYLFNTLYEAGLTPTNGTDPPVDEIDPIASFKCSVTRELSDGTIFQGGEVYTRDVALYSYTMGNAIAAFEEDIKGSIKVGKLADIAILSQDITAVPDNALMDTKVMKTILGGKVVYERE
ncbi:amidohydrolase [Pseudemcibacter aquimaris]|uniref:amidohydrolase n=1 Tax=Pseudemcibacter aquimaris TaxID=2857064 RepID=UPI0020130B4F|nr:amidohydrolase [Pseudemcibacter aquimaris]MCC3859914.1 amidohydrolase [Pseudemcibacter aquimaris]WDU57246.1 amidohydrolase [Pseudemcibacter aquimaris]